MALNAADASLQAALVGFRDALDPAQRAELQALNQVPDANAVITFTAQVDHENAKRKSRCVASRLCGVLDSVQEFSGVVETMVSSHPDVAALVWGSIKLFIVVASRFVSYFEKISEWFMNLRHYCPRYSEYAALFSSSVKLRAALYNFYATVIQFCKQAIQVFRRTGLQQFVKAIWSPFESEFSSFTKSLELQNKEVNEEIRLAAELAAFQERQLQVSHRKRATLFSKKLETESVENREWRLQAEERRTKKRREKLLNNLSTYNYAAALKQERKKRHRMTSSWLSRTREWAEWILGPVSSVFWCSGILGSGKTVLVAKMIDDLFCLRRPEDTICFFFCRFDQPQSLQAKTIIGSLVRQCFTSETLSKDIEAEVAKLFEGGPPDVEELGPLFEIVISTPQRCFIVIDALDECSEADRDAVFAALRRVSNMSRKVVKIFLASREGMSIEITKAFGTYHHKSMGTSEVQADIKTYIGDVIEEKILNGDLVVGTLELVKDICDALLEGAQGMFLYVKFQLRDICEQTCVEDIREVITHLPKDLPETFERVLSRISKSGQGKVKIAEKVFRWVVVAKRPLDLEELQEAIAVEPCQPSFNPEKLVTNIDHIVPWCRGLVTLDEEEQVVQFAHHSVKHFLLSRESNLPSQNFHFRLSQADHEAGETCVTYLNFDDFKRQVAKFPSSNPPVEPRAILRAAMSTFPGSPIAHSWSKLERFRSNPREARLPSFDTVSHLSHLAGGNGPASFQKLQTKYAFLAYASEYWLPHTAGFEDSNTATWNLWKHLLVTSDTLAQAPWTSGDWIRRTRKLMQYIVENNHGALLRLIANSKPNDLSQNETQYALSYSASLGHAQLVKILVELGNVSKRDLNLKLCDAAAHGQSEKVRSFLQAGADATAMHGHSDKVHSSLQAGADAAAMRGDYHTSQSMANLEGIDGVTPDQVMRLLLVDEAHVRPAEAAVMGGGGLTALHLAASFGHLSVIQMLLEKVVDIDVRTYLGYTALHSAAYSGHESVVQLLLEKGADITAKNVYGQTALDMANSKNHKTVAKLPKEHQRRH